MERERVRKVYSEGWGHGKEESMGMVIIIKGGIRREISPDALCERNFPLSPDQLQNASVGPVLPMGFK